MPDYVTLVKYTSEGLAAFGDLADRLKRVEEGFKAAGGKLHSYHLTMGPYDAVVVGEMPDDESVARMAISIGAEGRIQTTTMRAFTRKEAEKIAGDLG